MAKLTRVTGKVFGETASATGNDPEIGQFGSAKAGTYVGTGDVATIQNLAAWSNGWIDAVTPTQQYPALPEMTGVHKVLSYQSAYLLQQGVPEWDSATTYYANSFCQVAGVLYKSKTDENLNNDPTSDTDNWEEFVSGGASRNIGEIVQSTIPLTDAGLHLLDGTLISGSGSYADFVDYIAELYNEGEETPVYESWTQPTLSENGTMGGSTAACASSSTYGGGDNAKEAFDGNSGSYWSPNNFDISASSPEWITFYNPDALKVSQVVLTFPTANHAYSSGEIQGSNDNSTWTTLASFSGNSSASLTISVTTSNAYKYIRLYITGTRGSGTNGGLTQFDITATKYAGIVVQAPPYFCTEADWQTAVSTYGVCGKFVYDSTNNTVRLPLITGFTEGTIDTTVLGDLTEAGLPNITGTANSAYFQGDNSSGSDSGSGALILSQRSGQGFQGQYGLSYKISIDASLSNPIYGNSNTVQPQSIKVLYYIVVATSTKTDIQVDIDEIATDLNGKMDSDLSNMSASSSAKNTITSWGTPDLSSGVSKSHNTLYQAETDGIIRLCIGTNNNSIQFRYGENSSVSNVLSVVNGAGVTSITGDLFIPKGTYYKTTGTLYTGSSMSNTIIFYPLKGAA